ncbi:MAG: hypothetical protein WC909_02855 [Candidatus Paceibacterota bacterium]|jgi:hypothetical protein
MKTLKENILDKIIFDILACLQPKIIKETISGINTGSFDEEKLKKYYTLLSGISFAHKKVLRYGVYFDKFYPDKTIIKENEALEHHVHAYLEDLTILCNKIVVFLSSLKNDLKKRVKDKKGMEESYEFLIKKVGDNFAKIAKARNPHHHKGIKFIDSNIIESQLASTMLENGKKLGLNFNEEYFKSKEKESFEKAKNKWIKIAIKNGEQISLLIGNILEKNEDILYDLLGIESFVDEIKKK